MKIWKLFIALALFFSVTVANAQTQSSADKWTHLKVYHQLLSKTFHPAEKGNFEPIKKEAQKLVFLAKDLNIDNMPPEMKSPKLIEGLEILQNQTMLLFETIQSKAEDKEIMVKFNDVHETFHSIEAVCEKQK